MTREDGFVAEDRAAVPGAVRIAAMVVAVVATTGLLWLLFTRTEGPAPVLREFAELVRDRDCAGSYGLLDGFVQRRMGEEEWCDRLPAMSERLDPGFRVEQMRLRESVAHLTIRGRLGTEPEVWRMRRHDRSWRVLGPLGGFDPPTGPTDDAETEDEPEE